MRLTRGPLRTIRRQDQGPPTPEQAHVLEAFRAFKAEISGQKGEASVRETLEGLGVPALHDVILRDDRGLTQIDHLVRAPDAILVLETKRYGGIVSGRIGGRSWTQRFADSAERFELPNPVRQNHRHMLAVEAAVGSGAVPLRSYIVAVGSGTFEGELRGVPVPLNALGRLVSGRASQAQLWLDTGWRRLEVIAARNADLHDAHRAALEARRR